MEISSGRDIMRSHGGRAESAIIAAVRTILQNLGDDPDRDGLSKTPERVARALLFLTSGYDIDTEPEFNNAMFDQPDSEMVLVRDIEISSLCEHHLMPFFGKIHIAYMPEGQVVGLSKLVRIANIYARRLQIQERLTEQVADEVHCLSGARGVAVMMECSHMCMSLRGVHQMGATTVTRSFTGAFKSDNRLREEFYASVNQPR